ncbi:S8 family serine peptidase [candidate division KSB1 bacterium]|nr:S8 family serine peptidase [candidate division KSB1 bacterium]
MSIAIAGALLARESGVKTASSPLALATQERYVPNVVVIKFKAGITEGVQTASTTFASLNALMQQQNIYQLEQVLPEHRLHRDVISRVNITDIYYAHFSGNASPAAVAEALRQDAHLEYAEPKYIHYLDAAPNDPQFSQQGFYGKVKATEAWDVVKGEQSDVVVAIVDGGTDRDHPDLAANFWSNSDELPGNGIDDDNNGFVDDVNGWNFSNNSNDPTGLSSTPGNANHGTHTAGIACAVTNNSTGIAGMSWNAKLMAICVSDRNSDGYLAFGTDGILYAANNGADVISLSWGRLGSSSAFEQDVIDFATDLGSLVVAAAGNDNTSAQHFPSAYRNVLAVANTTDSDTRNGNSNYGTWVDVSAPGTRIYSTFNNGLYNSLSGTSMSCPLVAGLAALVRTQHPTWTGIQAGEQVRLTADNIDAANPSYIGLLGKGRVNALRAATESVPAIRLSSFSFAETDGDGVIEPGETVTITTKMINYLAPATNVNLTLSEADNFATVTSANATIATISTLQEATPSAFRCTIAANAPSGHPVDFLLQISAPGYSDLDRFTLTILPTFGNVNVNSIQTTATNLGRIGYADPTNSGGGVGFHYKNGPSLLFEGAIMAGTGVGQVSNAARGVLAGNTQRTDQDFTIASDGDLRVIRPGALTDEESTGSFEDKAANNPMNIRITQATFAESSAPYDDFILLRYTIENQGNTTLNNFHFGFFYDWDIDGNTYATNLTEYDAQRKLGYAYDGGAGPKTYVGMAVITDAKTHYRAIYNDPSAPNNSTGWGLHDGFTDEEKWKAMSEDASFSKAGPADISFVLAVGPFVIPSKGKLELGFALLAGDNLQDLQLNADNAKKMWNELFSTAVAAPSATALPRTFALGQNFPNPFSPKGVASTSINFQLPHAEFVQLEILDVLGRKLRTILAAKHAAGSYSARWDGRDDAGRYVHRGVYFYRLHAGNFVQTRKLVLF